MGADVLMPHRRLPRGEPAVERADCSSRMAGKRAAIEDGLAGTKARRIPGNAFRGPGAGLEEEFAVATCLVNLRGITGRARGQGPGCAPQEAQAAAQKAGAARPQAPEDARAGKARQRPRTAGKNLYPAGALPFRPTAARPALRTQFATVKVGWQASFFN